MKNDVSVQVIDWVALKGVYTITKARIETEEQRALAQEIERKRSAGEFFIDLVRKLNEMCKTEVIVCENLIPTVGRQMIANNLTDTSPDNTMRIKYAEVGFGTTAPANGNIALETSTYRNAIASITNAANIAYATAFFAAAEVSGTFREAGIFCDGSITIGTGILLSRVAINISKSLTETLTIDWTLTIT